MHDLVEKLFEVVHFTREVWDLNRAKNIITYDLSLERGHVYPKYGYARSWLAMLLHIVEFPLSCN